MKTSRTFRVTLHGVEARVYVSTLPVGGPRVFLTRFADALKELDAVSAIDPVVDINRHGLHVKGIIKADKRELSQVIDKLKAFDFTESKSSRFW